jgi:hypothetical protein
MSPQAYSARNIISIGDTQARENQMKANCAVWRLYGD